MSYFIFGGDKPTTLITNGEEEMTKARDRKFVPRRFLEARPDPQDCCHQLLTKSGYDNGEIGISVNCLLCGANMRFKPNANADLSGTFVFQELGPLTKCQRDLVDMLITYVCNRYYNEDEINIGNIFNRLYPAIDEIGSELGRPTKSERPKVKQISK